MPSSMVTGVAQDPAVTAANAQPATLSLPTFTRTYNAAGKDYSYTVIGGDPGKGETTAIPTVLVPITLTIEAPMDATGKKAVLDASPDAAEVIHSPIFATYAFASGKTQYTDAMMRTDFYKEAAKDWHTLLGRPKVACLFGQKR